jgi:hypothetical protein
MVKGRNRRIPSQLLVSEVYNQGVDRGGHERELDDFVLTFNC